MVELFIIAKPLKLDSILKDQERFLVSNTTLYNDTSAGGIFRAASLNVGAISISEPLISYYKNNIFSFDSCDFKGIIGNQYFEKFKVLIDFKNEILFLTPNEKFKERMTFQNVGFLSVNRSDITEGEIINGFYLNSEAFKSGIKYGDIITHINGVSVKTFTLGQKVFKEKNKIYEFVLRRGDSTFKFRTKVTEK